MFVPAASVIVVVDVVGSSQLVPVTGTSIPGPPLTPTKNERVPLTVESMNSVYSPAVSTCTSSNTR